MPTGDPVVQIAKENLYEEILVISRTNPHTDLLVRGRIYGFGTCAAFGQSYYSAPYADPLSQLLYYLAPPVQDQYYAAPRMPPQRYQHQETSRSAKTVSAMSASRTSGGSQESKHEHQDREHQDREHQDHGQRY